MDTGRRAVREDNLFWGNVGDLGPIFKTLTIGRGGGEGFMPMQRGF